MSLFKRDWELINTVTIPDMEALVKLGLSGCDVRSAFVVQTFKCKRTNKIKVVRTSSDWPYQCVESL